MSEMYSFTEVTAEVVGVAVNIMDVIIDAIRLSEKIRLPVNFEFNGVKLAVHSGSNPYDVYSKWEKEMYKV